ncbi:hypothetical protein [Actinokineospora sp. HUAS TT18]|uniref:hypothetical protein n=1 Tax=Actinokineospora sp. HUAS TT18 TaxID=3447451 RepID=UPI003F51BA6E
MRLPEDAFAAIRPRPGIAAPADLDSADPARTVIRAAAAANAATTSPIAYIPRNSGPDRPHVTFIAPPPVSVALIPAMIRPV